MKTSRTKIAKTIAAKTIESGANDKLAREIAAYLLSERRVGDLGSLMRDVQAAWADSGHVEVIAKSAYGLNDSLKADIETKIKQLFPAAKKIIITRVHDPGVIGGVRLGLANQQLDLSIKTKLNKFKQLTMEGSR